jgi:phosphate starvation-inducible PhoH-like protein
MPRFAPESEGRPGDVKATSEVEIDDTAVLLGLTGARGDRLRALERELGIECGLRGNTVFLRGSAEPVALAERFLSEAAALLRQGVQLGTDDIARAVHVLRTEPQLRLRDVFDQAVPLGSGRKPIAPKGLAQKKYVESIRTHDMTFGIGPAGTGKTYLAMACAVQALLERRVKRIVLTRPAVEAGEKLGFLPGDLAEKVNPYLRPLYDALDDMMDIDRAQGMIARGQIEVAPLAFMRGRTLNDSFVVLDEAQNTTSEQMRMFLTRLGYNSRAVVTGDVTQVDLPEGRASGLAEARELLAGIEGIAFCEFSDADVVRHPLVQKIIVAYEKRDAARDAKAGRPGPQLFPRRTEPPGPISQMPATVARPGPVADGERGAREGEKS